jgi:hypothetical protein
MHDYSFIIILHPIGYKKIDSINYCKNQLILSGSSTTAATCPGCAAIAMLIYYDGALLQSV